MCILRYFKFFMTASHVCFCDPKSVVLDRNSDCVLLKKMRSAFEAKHNQSQRFGSIHFSGISIGIWEWGMGNLP